jgi:alpha-beta hydrolase superfamily lysophospholipase
MASTPTDSARIPLLLIHGAWLSARSWETYADYFGKRGFAVSAPEWRASTATSRRSARRPTR